MKRFFLAALALAGCVPQLPSTATPDALAVRYEVRIGQTALPNVRGVDIDGPDIELVEFRQGSQPQGPVTLAPGRVGRITLVIRTDWAAVEQTMETWRATLTGAVQTPTLSPTSQTITIAITSPGGGTPATYSFQRCLPSEHDMQLAGQDARIEQVWRVTCETVQRS